MLYKYSLSETFTRFVLLKCWVFTLLYPPPPWNTQCMFDFGKACASVIWRQYSVNCMASRSPPRQFNWVDFILLISWRLFPEFVFSPRQCDSCSDFGFLLWQTQKHSLASFLSLLSAVFCEQTITCWRNNKSLLGMTSWEFCFQFLNLMYLKFRSF